MKHRKQQNPQNQPIVRVSKYTLGWLQDMQIVEYLTRQPNERSSGYRSMAEILEELVEREYDRMQIAEKLVAMQKMLQSK